jgi:hypothetical protein
MTTAEVHIDFQQKLQKVSSYVFNDYSPQEIDWVINEHQFKLLRTMLTRSSNRKQEGFEDTQIRVDLFEALKEVKTLTAFHASNEEQYVILPPDYFQLINEVSNLQYNCLGLVKSPTAYTLYTLVFKFPVITTLAHYASLKIYYTVNGVDTLVYNAANYSTMYSSFGSLEEKFYAITHIFETLNKRSDVEVYWERYGDSYTSDSFVFVTKNPLITSVTFNINGVPIGDDFSGAAKTITTSLSAKQYKSRDNRLVKSEKVYRYLRNPHNTTSHESPLETMRKGQLRLYTNSFFYLDSLTIEYLRRPLYMNSRTGQTIELGSTLGLKQEITRQIVDAAVQTTAARLASGNYQFIAQENLLNE